jgi:hypothetical protein
MKKNNFLGIFSFVFLILMTADKSTAEIMILSSCDNKKDGFLKNEYILDLEKSLMTRNFVYSEKNLKNIV